MIILNNTQRALKIQRNTFGYRLLELRIVWRRLWYGNYHEKTRELIRERNEIELEVIRIVEEYEKLYKTKENK